MHGVKLRSQLVGGKRITSAAWVDDFLAALNPTPQTTPQTEDRTTKGREGEPMRASERSHTPRHGGSGAGCSDTEDTKLTEGARATGEPCARTPSPIRRAAEKGGRAAMLTKRRALSEIMEQGKRADLARTWDTTEAAKEMGPLPRGEYIARIIEGASVTSRANTPGYELTFQVLEGEYEGRRFWYQVWLTPAAMSIAKRDLGKLGITSLEQLERPFPRGIRCRVNLALRRDDNGTEYNRVQRFEMLGIDQPKRDPFAPEDGGADSPGADTPGQA